MKYELHKYIAASGMSKSGFARTLGVAPSTVSDWLRGYRKPMRSTAVRIEKMSGGAVPVDCWDIEE